MKELKAIKPEFYITEELTIHRKKSTTKYKLLFSNDFDSLLKAKAFFKFNNRCAQEIREHICLRVYSNQYDSLNQIKPEEIPMLTIFSKLNGLYESQERNKTTEGIPK